LSQELLVLATLLGASWHWQYSSLRKPIYSGVRVNTQSQL
jgi:hypothetical protein